MTGKPSFDEYLASLSAVSFGASAAEPEALDLCVSATAVLAALDPLDRGSLAAAIAADPQLVPVLAAVANLSQERLKSWLQQRFATAGWVTLARTRAGELVDALDDDLDLLALLAAQATRQWTWADVLARGMAPRQRAGSAVQQGRNLEDDVERIISDLGLAFDARTRFHGTGGQTAPSDFAVPSGLGDALIAVAVKGFDSTGSKLGDAAREIDEMAKVRKPTQFIFAVVDGQGWHRRQSDLRRIHRLWTDDRIDGVFTRSSLPAFGDALRDAGRRVGLL